MKKIVSISIDADILKLADEEAWRGRMSRSQYFESRVRPSVLPVVKATAPPLKRALDKVDNQAKLDKTREKLVRKKSESNAAWQIRRKVFNKR